MQTSAVKLPVSLELPGLNRYGLQPMAVLRKYALTETDNLSKTFLVICIINGVQYYLITTIKLRFTKVVANELIMLHGSGKRMMLRPVKNNNKGIVVSDCAAFAGGEELVLSITYLVNVEYENYEIESDNKIARYLWDNLHCEDGPAIKSRDGSYKAYYWMGRLERRDELDMPAEIWYHENGMTKQVLYYQSGHLSRVANPAMIRYSEAGHIVEQRWYIKGVQTWVSQHKPAAVHVSLVPHTEPKAPALPPRDYYDKISCADVSVAPIDTSASANVAPITNMIGTGVSDNVAPITNVIDTSASANVAPMLRLL